MNEREATANAGRIAGLNVRRVINEPTAAALAYGVERGRNQVVLVFDLGGGTFDITMIEVKGQEIKVICTGGDHNLGGKDWDKAIVDYLAVCFRDQTGMQIDILEDPETCRRCTSRRRNRRSISRIGRSHRFASLTPVRCAGWS